MEIAQFITFHHILHKGQSSKYGGMGEKHFLLTPEHSGQRSREDTTPSMFTLAAYPVYPACSHCEWTGSILLKWLKTRGFFDESSQRLQCLKPQWLAEGGAERTTSFVFRSRTGKLDNHWAQLPHLRTPGGGEANYFKIHSLRKFEIC